MKQLLNQINSGENLSVFGLPFFNRLIALHNLDRFLYVCADLPTAKKAYEQFLSLSKSVVLLPELDDTMCSVSQSIENNLTRLKAINSIALTRVDIVVTTVLGYMQLYPMADELLLHTITINKDNNYDIEWICKALVRAGYKKSVQAEEIGQFALRGGILDISPVNLQNAVRLDFFGETLEKIRIMDIDSQLCLGELDSITIAPACESFPPDSEVEQSNLIKALQKALPKNANERAGEIISNCVAAVQAKDGDRFLNFLKPLLNQCKIEEFFNARVIFDEAKRCVDNFNIHLSEHSSRFSALFTQGLAFDFSLAQLRKDIKPSVQAVAFDRFLCQNRIFTPQSVLNYQESETIEYPKNKKILIDDVNNYLNLGYSVVVPSIKQSRELFGNINAKSLSFSGELLYGAKFEADKIVYIGVADIISKKSPIVGNVNKKATFFEPKINDYVVHPVHGIGLCEGIIREKVGNSERDFVVVRYEGGTLLVSCENLNIISAYAGEENPKLNRIGGQEFAKAKERAKKAIQEMAFDLSRLYASRSAQRGHKYNPNPYQLSEFEAEFPYEETPCQLEAVKECLLDITSGKVMDRLLCGDVGYGKTEVAMRVAYKVVLEGKQVAFISPTTVLSKQHFSTLTRRMNGFGVNIGSLTRFDTPVKIQNTIKGLKDGSIDIVCGTHRVLSKDVGFKDLGLLVLDEEQRFGVADKEKIKLLKTDVNVLSLSATPIPRTLHMAMSGMRDISTLNTPPRGRIEVSTYVCAYSDSLVYDAISREINRKGQAFIVYNRVEYIETYASTISKMFPELKIRIAHGQMDKERLEQAITDFIEGNADILIASTIIENGIDMANVNTMIVVDADKLGLGQMYQLRGRIGRGNRQAYAYFTFDSQKILTENAYKRLDAITSYTRFGSGFKLAMADLEIRGAGNVLGAQQHGHIQKIGYDMYLRLINDVMSEINGNSAPTPLSEIRLSIDFDAFIPDSYIPDIEWRLKAYSKISALSSTEQAQQEILRLQDVYGNVPLCVKNLIFASLIKNLCAKQNAIGLTLTKSLCEIRFAPSSPLPEELLKKALSLNFTYSPTPNTLSQKSLPNTTKTLLDLFAQ